MRPQNYSTYISPYYADVLLLMRKHQDSAEVATQMDMSREAVAFAVAEIERKLDTVLFTRHCGQPHTVWQVKPGNQFAWARIKSAWDPLYVSSRAGRRVPARRRA